MKTTKLQNMLPLARAELDELLFNTLRAVYQFERLKVSLFGLTFEEIYLLQFLRRRQSCKVGDIADEMKIHVSTLSRTIGRLQRKGLVDRTPNPEDRRIMQVSLKEKGLKLVLEVEAHTFDLITENLFQFKTKDINSFIKTALALKHILKPIEKAALYTNK